MGELPWLIGSDSNALIDDAIIGISIRPIELNVRLGLRYGSIANVVLATIGIAY